MEDPHHLIGQVLLDKLRVVRCIGTGGMGAVYEVEHLITKHHRALKVLHKQYAESSDAVARFLREAGVAGTLKTPHVVETLDAGQLPDGSPYLLMELLEGQSLRELIGRGPLSVERTLELMRQACDGIAIAHREGIVHRDLKPDNLFVSQRAGRDELKILDFGVSKFAQPGDPGGALTRPGQVLGSPYYMSPEQARGEEVDVRADIYAMGVIAYECLSGSPPFLGKTLTELIVKIHEGKYVPLPFVAPHVSQPLADAVGRAMHRDQAGRFSTVQEFIGALQSPLPQGSTEVLPEPLSIPLQAALPSTPQASPPRLRGDRNGLVLFGGAALAFAGVVAVGFALANGILDDRSEQPRPPPPPEVTPSEAVAPVPVEPAPTVPMQPVAPPAPEEPVTEVPPPEEPEERVPLTRSEMTRPPTRAGPGIIAIHSRPWSHVTIDGRGVGNTPYRGRLPPGRHVVMLQTPDGMRVRRVVMIRAGERTNLVVPITRNEL